MGYGPESDTILGNRVVCHLDTYIPLHVARQF